LNDDDKSDQSGHRRTICGALRRFDSAPNRSAAPRQPAPHMITTLPALSIRRAISATSASLAVSSPRGFS
jgi:hypothetical protein